MTHVKAAVDNGEQNVSLVVFETQRRRRSDAAKEDHLGVVFRDEIFNLFVLVDKAVELTVSGADVFGFCSANRAFVLHYLTVLLLLLAKISASLLQALLMSILIDWYIFWSCGSSSLWGGVCLINHKRFQVSSAWVARSL